MQVNVESRNPAETPADLLALPLYQMEPGHWRLPPRVAAVDRSLEGQLSAVLGSGDFLGKRDEGLLLYPVRGVAARRLVLLGLGDEARTDLETLRRAAGRLVSLASGKRAPRVALLVPALRRLRPRDALQALVEGGVLAGYRFDRYRAKNDSTPTKVTHLTFLVERGSEPRVLRASAAAAAVAAESQNLARDLSNESPSVLPPLALAREAERVAREVGLRVRVVRVPELRRRKAGAILAVGGGSANPPCLIVLEYNAPPGARRGAKRGPRRRPTVCLVGKGITFDSGGLSIKPSASMASMKHDMSGGAAVIAVLRAAALLRLPLHLVGVVGAAENMPSGTAYRPDDVVTTLSGRTVEISNTDAEGRLVLADALHFAREFEPDAIIDVATLTGACSVALGNWASAVLGNNERLVEALRRAGEASGERVWPLPLWEEHREEMKGRVSDLKQTGGRNGGTITAAAFLSFFTEGVPWAHLDIAPTAHTDRAGPYQPHGATGVGVRLLLELLRSWKEIRLV